MQRQQQLQDAKVNVRVKLAALWASFMFLYLYVDYFALHMPGHLGDLMQGKVFVFDITQTFLSVALISVTVPALMIFLSVALPARTCRWANLILAAVYIPYSLFNLAGEAWAHMIFGAALEVALLILILWLAWRWPRTDHTSGQRP